MNEEKIRAKYPNIQSEDEFDKLCRMLKFQKMSMLAMIFAVALLALGGLLYQLNSTIAIVCILVGGIGALIVSCKRDKYIDEFFLATAMRRKVENRILLNSEIVRNAMRKFIAKQVRFDLITSGLFAFACGIVLVMLSEDGVQAFPFLLFFGANMMIVFGIIRLFTFISKRKTEKEGYHLLRAKIEGRRIIESSDAESSSENYYFEFDCADYGKLDFDVGRNDYYGALVGQDEYYLVVMRKRFSKKYNITCIFFADEHVLSPELEQMVNVI